jgi:hypothetical protein
MIDETTLTPELEAFIVQKIMENKPYLLAIEERVQEIKNGEMEVKVFVRTGVVEKIEFKKAFQNWFKPKVDLTSKG